MFNIRFENKKLKWLIYSFIFFNLSFYKAIAQATDSTDVLYTGIHLDLTNYKSRTISGFAEIVCKPVTNLSPKLIQLYLLKLVVDSVNYQPSGSNTYEPVNFHYNDTVLKVFVGFKDTARLKIYYHGSPVKDAAWGGFYFSNDYTFNLGVGFRAEPHLIGRMWFPSGDRFEDKCIYEYFINSPKGFAAICGGLLIDTTDFGVNTLWHWKHSVPVSSYLVSVAQAPYRLLKDSYTGSSGTIPILLAAVPSDTANLKSSFVNLKLAMQVFEDYYGTYLFERIGYSLVPFSDGAMEHACNIAYPVSFANGSRDYESYMAHELSHHWWGNNITCATASDMWLNEGWARYSEYLFYEKALGKKDAQEAFNKLHQRVLRYSHLRDGGAKSVNNISSEYTYGSHVYDKGGSMVHSIRHAMGDSLFKIACRSFITENKLGNVNTGDLILKFNKIGDLPTGFIDQIISDTGFCHFSIYNTETQKNSLWDTKVTYKQRQKLGNHLYNDMPFEISVFDEHFKRKILKVNLGTAGSFNFSSDFKPVFICIDYDQKFTDAITDDVILTSDTGYYENSNSLMGVHIVEIKDTSLIRIEHNWVYPDAYFLNIPNVLISKERYWTVDGIFDASLKATGTIYYDGTRPSNYSGGWLDNELFNGRREDSLVLLYRESATSYWKIESDVTHLIGHPIDKRGTLRINKLKKGEYALGVYGKETLNDLGLRKELNVVRVFPNPADGTVSVYWDSNETVLKIELYNETGQRLWVNNTKDMVQTGIKIDTQHLTAGKYIIHLVTQTGKEYSKVFIKN
ncbi:MAG: T9SS type A sorting domain-containing protein [Flavobacteriales bacterium]|nr:T9SS type A sorting domain-containing protein [Flavobacteriales bacterium]